VGPGLGVCGLSTSSTFTHLICSLESIGSTLQRLLITLWSELDW
jgi:hypothetical protein